VANGNLGDVTSLECRLDVAMTTGLCRVTSRLMTSPVTRFAADGDVGVAAAVTKVNRAIIDGRLRHAARGGPSHGRRRHAGKIGEV